MCDITSYELARLMGVSLRSAGDGPIVPIARLGVGAEPPEHEAGSQAHVLRTANSFSFDLHGPDFW